MVNYFKTLNTKNEKALKTKTTELEEINNFKSQFFANISHEIRTPITLIKGQIDELKEQSKNNNILIDIHKNIDYQSNKITEIVNSVLDLARMETSNFKLETQCINISEVIQKAYLNFEPLFKQKNIGLTLNTKNKNYYVKANKVFIERAINNIIVNALKYTNSGKVDIDITRKNNLVYITVKDTGIGISKENINKIFNRFYQVNNDINQAGGSGIGLAFSKEIIGLHNGKLSVKSKINEGSSFKFSLPIIEEPNLKAKFIPKTKSTIHTKRGKNIPFNYTFLIVDDNYEMRVYLKNILKNYNCIEAENGIEALKKLNENEIDFIISDYMMPKLNGYDFAKQVVEKENHPPIILLTAKADNETKIKSLRLGIDDYITKPFNKEELLIRIQKSAQNFTSKKVFNSENNISNKEIQQNTNFIESLKQFINENSHKNLLNQDFIAERFNISKSSLYRKIKSESGLSPTEFITEVKLKKAKTIVDNNPNILLKQLAIEVGYNHTSYFSKIFEERFGHKPIRK